MLTNSQILELLKNSKKQLVYALIVALFAIIILFTETIFSRDLSSLSSDRLFTVNQKTQDQLSIKYDLDSEFQKYDRTIFKAPKVLATEDQIAGFTVMDSAYVVLGPESTLNTLKFLDDSYHGVLLEGSLLFDTSTELNKVTFQTANLLVKPFPSGRFYLSKQDSQIQLNILSGNAEVEIYSETGQLQRTILLSSYNQISAFDALAVEGDIEIEKPVKTVPLLEDALAQNLIPSVSSLIVNKDLFTINYKGENIKPESSNAVSGFLANLSFNQKRKDYYKILPFYIELNELLQKSTKSPITAQDTANLNQIYLAEISTDFSANAQFKDTLKKKYPYILAISPEDNAYELKLYLSEFLNFVSPAQKIMTGLQDLYSLYPANKIVTVSLVFEDINKQIPSIGKKDAKDIIAILDNIAETTIQANTKDLFDSRNLAFEKLTTTIEKVQFRTKTKQHLARLENAFKSNQLSTPQIKSAAESLLSTLDSGSQADYQQFLLSLSQ